MFRRLLVFLAVAIGLGAAAVTLVTCSKLVEELPSFAGGCGETRVSSAASPDGRYVAAVFLRDCGATTGYVTHVNLRRSSEAFTPDRDGIVDRGTVFLREGKDPVSVRWRTGAQLVITAPLTEVFQKADSWEDVRIVYREPPARRGQ